MTVREIRKNPFTGEWVIFSDKRQARPDREKDFCPLCNGSAEVPKFTKPSRIPNKFPSLSKEGDSPRKIKQSEFREKMSGYGSCELIVYTDVHNAKFIDLTTGEILEIFQTWIQATKEFGSDPSIKYILPFENYGPDVGATLLHPHGQLYAFPFIPNSIQNEFDSILKYRTDKNECMTCNFIKTEEYEEERIVFSNESVIALIPYFARYAYDVYIYPKRHASYLHQSTRNELTSIIDTIKRVISAVNESLEVDLSYSLSLNQAPLNSKGSNYFHYYFKVHTPQRNPKSKKLLGAVETSTMTYINGTMPENAAKEVREKISQSF